VATSGESGDVGREWRRREKVATLGESDDVGKNPMSDDIVSSSRDVVRVSRDGVRQLDFCY